MPVRVSILCDNNNAVNIYYIDMYMYPYCEKMNIVLHNVFYDYYFYYYKHNCTYDTRLETNTLSCVLIYRKILLIRH
jgi:hypothetical protein